MRGKRKATRNALGSCPCGCVTHYRLFPDADLAIVVASCASCSSRIRLRWETP